MYEHVELITARKRSLGQGNVFTSVCQSFCSQVCWGGGLCPGGGFCQRDPPRTKTPPTVWWRAGGTHPTGMHSCLYWRESRGLQNEDKFVITFIQCEWTSQSQPVCTYCVCRINVISILRFLYVHLITVSFMLIIYNSSRPCLSIVVASIVTESNISSNAFPVELITARNEVGARLYFHRCLWFCPQGGVWSGGPCPGGCLVETPRDGWCCGRYASYWN